METMKNAINWFEIPALDFDRAVKFYGDIYANEMPSRDTGQVKMGFFSHEQGQVGGAVIAGEGYTPSNKAPSYTSMAGLISTPCLTVSKVPVEPWSRVKRR